MAPLPSWLWGLGVVPRPRWLGSVGGVSPRRPLCVPSLLCLFAALLGVVCPWCPARAFPAVVGGGVVLVVGSGPFPWCFPLRGPLLAPHGVTLLYRPSICTRSVQMDLLRSQVLQPFPTRGRVNCGSQGSPCGIGVSLACPDRRCALPAAPRWARTAVRAARSALGQAHWSPTQAGATAGR